MTIRPLDHCHLEHFFIFNRLNISITWFRSITYSLEACLLTSVFLLLFWSIGKKRLAWMPSTRHASFNDMLYVVCWTKKFKHSSSTIPFPSYAASLDARSLKCGRGFRSGFFEKEKKKQKLFWTGSKAPILMGLPPLDSIFCHLSYMYARPGSWNKKQLANQM